MTTFELLFLATVLRGAFAVLFLLAAEAVLRERLGAGFRRLLWMGCLILILVPQMNFSASPFRLDLSPLRTAAAGPGAGRTGSVSALLSSRETALRAATNGDMFRVFRHRIQPYRKPLAIGLIGLLPLPALFLLLRRYRRCRRMIRPLPPVTDARVLKTWRRVLEECGPLPRPVILLDSGERQLGPTLFGCFTRKLLLPVDSLRELSDEELLLLLEHEYHHNRAGDPFLNILSLVLWAFAWYNPFMCIARRKLRASCELECDRKILARHPNAVREYGKLLLRFAAPSAPAALPVTIGLAESPHELSRRIRSMTAAHIGGGRQSAGKWAALLIAAALLAPVCLIAVNARPASRPRPAATVAGKPRPALPAKPVLPHLVLTPCGLKSKPTGLAACWMISYPESFPFRQGRLLLEIGDTVQEISLAPEKRFLLLWSAEAEGCRAEAAELLSPEETPLPLHDPKVLAADRKPYLTNVDAKTLPVLRLTVDGIGPEELSGYLPPPVYRR